MFTGSPRSSAVQQAVQQQQQSTSAKSASKSAADPSGTTPPAMAKQSGQADDATADDDNLANEDPEEDFVRRLAGSASVSRPVALQPLQLAQPLHHQHTVRNRFFVLLYLCIRSRYHGSLDY